MVQDCIFCKIVAGEIPCEQVYADDLIIAFHDISPQAPTHILVIPRKHISDMNEASAEDQAVLGHMMLRASEIAAEAGLAESGYRLALNTGPDARQSVFHIHLHILGGRRLTGQMG
ncbi:MAG: histidine triad nucleotide-binding protein [Gammaproteobacteria bacterium]|nr:histidine triad nucleotide-binding protein [Gammaproteobacteria bacterium]MYA37574.1 histidine triad nucleotide-binding protein [Gammaproteobacteria bacterium]MYE99441.1 histidine triad nucleotide-binding protein [Gammaproteobacteria bacterium]MYG97624.1 histidine triad nucleotide-binding protein [Gammaproteobacteria bacterium]MYH85365.1 histidine triad nucleotide-binding protein [Gammaproteobacteria bacterium]